MLILLVQNRNIITFYFLSILLNQQNEGFFLHQGFYLRGCCKIDGTIMLCLEMQKEAQIQIF